MTAAIVNHLIAGTRITVWDVYHYLERGRSAERIAEILNLSPEQVQATIQYIEENKDYVLEVHQQIEERIARGNPPEIESLRAASKLKMQAWLEERHRAKNEELNGEGHPGGR
jgi:uncharacterized protein (DUF433 family)